MADPQLRRRFDLIRNLYGPDNASVRREVRLLEERSERSQTGFLGDPSHQVPYKNHPYDKERRHLEETDMESLFEPMRITFETRALDGMRNTPNAAKIDFIKNEILPRTADFWTKSLAVVPVDGDLLIAASELEGRRYCGDSEFTEVPDSHISRGVPNTDLVLYVSGTPSTRFCSGSTLAVAVACNFDQFDRPTAGAINVCLDQIDLNNDGTASEAVIEDNVDVAIHEVAHVLGHSSNSYRFFWDPDTGSPRTPRPFQTSTVTCVDGLSRSLVLPAENTLKFGVANNGQRFASIVTPKVQAVARNQFDCQSLDGAQLENQPTGSGSCTGDHWDERLYYPSAMSGVISPTTNILSHLTLALMEDSGWYKANYTQGRMTPWGLGAGCAFAEDACLVPSADNAQEPEVPPYGRGYFCTDGSQRGCSPALTHKLACSVLDYDYILPRDLPDPQFQYFPNSPTKGGPRQADFCPVFGSSYSGRDVEALSCKDPDNSGSIDIYGEEFGPDSQCIPTDSGDARCFETRCIKDDRNLRIRVKGEWLTCDYDFQVINVDDRLPALAQDLIGLKLVCPRLSTACPDLFCPFNCAGRGVCNFNAQLTNTTRGPKCECFDPADTSPGCSDSQIPQGDFLDDASGLFDNLEENFFDPLVAVFVDHPDKWTTASWAWAAGLLICFIIMLLCICSSFYPEKKGGKA